jgi:hypothetical protein
MNSRRLNELCAAFLAARAAKKEAELIYNSAKTKIIELLGDHTAAETKRFEVSYNNNEKLVVDIGLLKTERPDIYQKFLWPQECWVLTVHKKGNSVTVVNGN